MPTEEGGARLVQLSCAGERVVVAEAHLAKLWSLWQAHGAAKRRRRRRRLGHGKRRRRAEGEAEGLGEEGVDEEAEAEAEAAGAAAAGGAGPPLRLRPFLAASYCCLARLLALQGGDERSGGMQAAYPAAAC